MSRNIYQKIAKIAKALGSDAEKVTASTSKSILFINLKSLMCRITGREYKDICSEFG
jgi:hypothetical protein